MTIEASNLSVMDAIARRHSVRAYLPDLLERSTVDQLLAAAVRAPTAIHEEQWVFVVVQGLGTLKALSAQVRAPFAAEVSQHRLAQGSHPLEYFNSPDFNLFYDASTLILICAEPMGPFVSADCWLAAENLMLAACAMGLGSCVIGSSIIGLNLPEVKAQLGIPEEITVVAPIVVGRMRERGAPTQRKPPVILSWKESLT